MAGVATGNKGTGSAPVSGNVTAIIRAGDHESKEKKG